MNLKSEKSEMDMHEPARLAGHGKTRIATDGIEYAIYIHHPANDDRNACSWERAATTHCRNAAMQEARKLYNSQKYEKVEIKRNMFDRARGLRHGDTLLVFGDTPPRKSPRATPQTAIYLAFALLSAALTLILITGG